MSIKLKRFKPGDYVEIIPGVNDIRMPDNRRDGLVVEITGKKRDQFIVMFHNKAFLKFHASQLILLEKLYPSR